MNRLTLDVVNRATRDQIVEAIVETIRAAGDEGVPASSIYTAMRVFGFSYEQYRIYMSALVRAGKLTKRGHTYFAV
jgi:hypothetical protein